MNRRSLLLSLGAALAAPAVIRTPGLLMPVREIPDRYVIRVKAGEVLSGKHIRAPWHVLLEDGAAIHHCEINCTGFEYGVYGHGYSPRAAISVVHANQAGEICFNRFTDCDRLMPVPERAGIFAYSSERIWGGRRARRVDVT